MRMVVLESATEVRKDFSRFIDQVIHKGPAFVRRSRDEFAALSLDQLELLLAPYRFHLDHGREKDGSVSGGLREVDLVGNAASVETLKASLAQDLVDYAKEYRAHFELYYHAPNRRGHLPYVLRVLLQENAQAVAGLIDD